MRECFNISLSLVTTLTALTLIGCSTLTTNQYEATALTTYTWQVKYAIDLANERSPRFETFATTSLLNRNGLKASGAVTGSDDQGLWWAALPPRPTVDEVEQRKKPKNRQASLNC
jgi:hypothetical protein